MLDVEYTDTIDGSEEELSMLDRLKSELQGYKEELMEASLVRVPSGPPPPSQPMRVPPTPPTLTSRGAAVDASIDE